MQTIVDKNTGQELYATALYLELAENEIAVDELRNIFMLKPYFNLLTREFYETATQQEIDDYNKTIVPSEVALWKIRVILKIMQLEEVVANALNSLEEPTKTAALYIWNYGTAIDRDSQTIAYLQSVLQLTDNQVDEIFIQSNDIKL